MSALSIREYGFGNPRGLRSASAAGFSLIELMIVICLLGLLAGAVMIGVETAVPSFRIEGAARKLAATVANLRAEAAISGLPRGIEYDLENGAYTMLVPPETGEGAEPEPVEADDLKELKPDSLGTGIIIEDVAFGERKIYRSRVKVVFGASEFAPPHLVHLTCGDLKYTVEVNTVTGLVETYEGHGEFDVLLSEEKFEKK